MHRRTRGEALLERTGMNNTQKSTPHISRGRGYQPWREQAPVIVFVDSIPICHRLSGMLPESRPFRRYSAAAVAVGCSLSSRCSFLPASLSSALPSCSRVFCIALYYPGTSFMTHAKERAEYAPGRSGARAMRCCFRICRTVEVGVGNHGAARKRGG